MLSPMIAVFAGGAIAFCNITDHASVLSAAIAPAGGFTPPITGPAPSTLTATDSGMVARELSRDIQRLRFDGAPVDEVLLDNSRREPSLRRPGPSAELGRLELEGLLLAASVAYAVPDFVGTRASQPDDEVLADLRQVSGRVEADYLRTLGRAWGLELGLQVAAAYSVPQEEFGVMDLRAALCLGSTILGVEATNILDSTDGDSRTILGTFSFNN